MNELRKILKNLSDYPSNLNYGDTEAYRRKVRIEETECQIRDWMRGKVPEGKPFKTFYGDGFNTCREQMIKNIKEG